MGFVKSIDDTEYRLLLDKTYTEHKDILFLVCDSIPKY